MAPDLRDSVIDFVHEWAEKTEIPQERFIAWIGISRGKFYEWQKNYGKVREARKLTHRDNWLTPAEQAAIVAYHDDHPIEGYRRLTYMMMDNDVVACSPATVYRVLKKAGRLDCRPPSGSTKGTGFEQPLKPHEHWHIDIAYLNIRGSFYYICGVLDGCSRYLVHWEIRESMKEQDIEIIVQKAKEKFPDARPRVISDNGPQFVAKDFQAFIRLSGFTHVRTSPYYPQSNGKIERWNKTYKRESHQLKPPATLQEAITLTTDFVVRYNEQRLHSAINYVTPKDKLLGLETAILEAREQKLIAAREQRRLYRMSLISTSMDTDVQTAA